MGGEGAVLAKEGADGKVYLRGAAGAPIPLGTFQSQAEDTSEVPPPRSIRPLSLRCSAPNLSPSCSPEKTVRRREHVSQSQREKWSCCICQSYPRPQP